MCEPFKKDFRPFRKQKLQDNSSAAQMVIINRALKHSLSRAPSEMFDLLPDTE
jgi:hypothetical protein